MKIEISGETMHLLWQKAIWLPHRKTLLAADLHFGKINHFRKAGIYKNKKKAWDLIEP